MAPLFVRLRRGWLIGAIVATPFVAACGLSLSGIDPAATADAGPANDASGALDSERPPLGTPDGATAIDAGASEGGSDSASEAGVLSPYAAAVLVDAPLAYWRLDETSGSTAMDSSGNNKNAVYSAATLGHPGAIANQQGTSARFNQLANITTQLSLPFTQKSPLTIEGWVRPTVQDGAVRWIFSWGTPNTNTNYTGDVQLYLTSSGIQFVRRTQSSGVNDGYVTYPIPSNVFSHVVVTYDGVNVRLYVNAVERQNTTSNVVVETPAAPTVAWGDHVSGQFYKFIGDLDELALYGKALTGARIAAHYTAAK